MPTANDVYRAAKVTDGFTQGSPGWVQYTDPESGATLKLTGKETQNVERMDKQSLRSIQDMVELKLLTDASLLHNLRKRYYQDHIYTNIGSILVSVNPYKWIGNKEDYVNRYLHGNVDETSEPHIFKTAERAYAMLMEEKQNQSCVITGESGAGKTEATKMFLHYIAKRSSKNAEKTGTRQNTFELQQKILETNPFVEAFGNAKTLRNDNSSRFGKLTELYLDSNKGIVNAARITSYLLEKSRVVKVAKGERNYHIFYQLCAAAVNDRPDLLRELHLDDASKFNYTMGDNTKFDDMVVRDGDDVISDSDGFRVTENSMRVLNLSDAEIKVIFKVLAGILHLGNIEFKKGKNTFSTIGKDVMNGAVKYAAAHLGVEAGKLARAVTERDLTNQSETVHKALTVQEAVAARDALAKHLYNNIFLYLITKMNDELFREDDMVTDSPTQKFIGILDIFGFEMFEENSFEQLCINYCNEKLQYFFNFHVFKREQQLYKSEGIPAEQVGFSDNMHIVETIEGGGESKHTGVIPICDDQAWLESSSDSQFLTHVLNAKNNYLQAPKVQDIRKQPRLANAFKIMHFAGEVHYIVDGFLEKNKDSLRVDLRRVAAASEHEILRNMFPNKGEGVQGKNAKYRKTLGTKFKDNLNKLMDKLNSTNPQFVRTIKPNGKKRANDFHSPMIFKQLKEAGLLEVCRIRKLGYPVRRTHKEFFRHFLCLDKSVRNVDELIQALDKQDLLYGDNLQKGKTMIFMRADQAEDLEQARMKALLSVVTILVRAVRSFLFRLNIRRASESMALIRQAMKERNAPNLQKGLEFFLAKGLDDLPEVVDAKELMKELQIQLEILKGLRAALDKDDVLEMRGYIEEAKKNDLGEDPLVRECEEVIETLEKRKNIKKALQNAMTSEDIEALKLAVDLALRNQLSEDSQTKLAQKALATLEERELLLAQLKDAMEAMNSDAINKLINRLYAIGTQPNDLMNQAAALKDVIIETNKKREKRLKKLEKHIRKAMESKNLKKLKDLQAEAYELQFSGNILTQMNRMIIQLERRAELFDEVENSTRALKRKMRSPEGIVVDESKARDDLRPLRHAIDVCLEDDKMYAAEVEIKNGEQLLLDAAEQLEAQKFIAKTLKKYLGYQGDTKHNPAFDRLEQALQLVQKLGLHTRDADTVVREYRKVEALKALADMMKNNAAREERERLLHEPTDEEREDHVLERAEKVWGNNFKKRAEAAYANEQYALRKFYRLRTDEDFVEFIEPVLKEEAKKKKLMWQRFPLQKSMLECDDTQNALAVRINTNILEYCGEIYDGKNLESRAKYIIKLGMVDDVLADEIYVQLCKHVSGNPVEWSADSAWRLMCQCATFFSCSLLFEPYLLHFLKSHENDRGLSGNYARFTLAQLSSSLMLSHKNYLPRHNELRAYMHRPPVLAQIERCDGLVMEIPVLPDLRLKMPLRMIRRLTKLKDNLKKPEWGIYVQAMPHTEVDFRERVYNFFHHWNKEKLYKVDKFVEYWKDNQESFFKQLVEVYGPEPPPAYVGAAKKKQGKNKKTLKSKASRANVKEQDEEETSDLDNMSTVSGRSTRSIGSSVGNLVRRASRMGMRTLKRDRNKGNKFEGMEEELAPTIAWPLPWWVHLGDVVGALYKQDRIPKLTFKRRILKSKGTPDELMYQQLLSEFKQGNLPLPSTGMVVNLAVTAFAIDMLKKKKQVPMGDKDAFKEEGLLNFMPVTVRRQKKSNEWFNKAVEVDLSRYDNKVKKLKQHFYEEVQKSPKYGMSFFIGKVVKGSMAGRNRYLSGNNNQINDNVNYTIGLNQTTLIFQHNDRTEYSLPMSAIKEIGTKDRGIFWFKCDKSMFKSHMDDIQADDEESSISGSQVSSASKPRKVKKTTGKKGRLFGGKNETIEVYTLQPKELFDIAWLFLHVDN